MTDIVQALLSALQPEGYRELRAILPNDRVSFNFDFDNFAAVEDFAKHHRDFNVYVAVAVRKSAEGGKLTDCSKLFTLFVDLDYKDFDDDEAKARAALAQFPHAPSAVVASDGGLQAYWLTTEPIALNDEGVDLAKRLLRALATKLGGDLDAAEPARILRLPDTLNYKYSPARAVVLESFDATRRYSLDEMLVAVGPLPAMKTERRTSSVPNVGIEQKVQQAREWLRTREPAIAGQGGDHHTFVTACVVHIDYDVPADDALAPLREWNARCVPPWSDADLKKRVANAAQYGDKSRRGHRLKAPGIVIRRASDVPDERLDKLFGGRLVRGAFAMLVGPGEAGKGMFSVDTFARLTTGEPFPGDSQRRASMNVLVCVTEDSAGRVKARLKAAGADLDRVFLVDGPAETRGGLTMPSPMMLDDDAGPLVRHAKDLNADAIFLETVVEHLGDRAGRSQHNTNNEAEVRRALAPFRAVVANAGLYGLGAIHPRKAIAGSIDDSISGSAAFRNVTRAVHHVYRDPEDESDDPVRLLVSSKSNYLRTRPTTLRFRIRSWDEGIGAPCTCPGPCEHEGRVVWEADLFDDRTAEDIWRQLAERNNPRRDESVKEAEDFLKEVLHANAEPLKPDVIWQLAKERDIAPRTLERAKKRLRIVSVKDGFPAMVVGWKLPDKRTTKADKEDLF